MAPDDAAPAEADEASGAVDAPAAAAEPVEALHGAPVTRSRGQVVLHPDRATYLEVVTALRADGYWMCVDLCGVDYLGYQGDRGLPAGVAPERFEVVTNHLNHTDRTRIRVRVQVPQDDPVLPTLFHVHPAVQNAERETFDLFGIRFDGHPDMTRILLPDDWEGHPLRKDYTVGRIPVQFKGAPSAR